MAEREGDIKWQGRTDGSAGMHRGLVRMLRLLGVRGSYAIMGMVIPFYMLFNHQGYLASYRFFRHRLGCAPLRAFGKVYRHHYKFGQVILDRFAMYAGKQYRFTSEGQELFDALAEGDDGFVMLSSHVGNYELAGYSLTSRRKRIHALMFGGETAQVMENRRKMFSQRNIEIVPALPDMSHVFALNAALSEGDIVSMPSDRIYGSQRSVECDFLGTKARFPLGPFVIAASRNLPALSVFVNKVATRRYHIQVRRIDCPTDVAGVRRKAEVMAQEFVAQMETIVRKYPTQWFNFYDFWA